MRSATWLPENRGDHGCNRQQCRRHAGRHHDHQCGQRRRGLHQPCDFGDGGNVYVDVFFPGLGTVTSTALTLERAVDLATPDFASADFDNGTLGPFPDLWGDGSLSVINDPTGAGKRQGRPAPLPVVERGV